MHILGMYLTTARNQRDCAIAWIQWQCALWHTA